MRCLWTVAVVCGLLAGCVPAQAGAALQAAKDFQDLVAAGSWQGACGALSEEARLRLENASARSCAEALPALGLVGTTASRVEVWGRNALADVGDDALFLSQFPDGWRVIAVGCTSRGEDRPYDCKVRG